MKDIEHLLRVAGVFVLVISSFLAVRHFLVPETFGKYGHYRAAAATETMDAVQPGRPGRARRISQTPASTIGIDKT